MVNPRGQTLFHAVAPVGGLLELRALFAIGAVGVMIAMAWRLRRVEWLAGFGIFWFLLMLVPSSALAVLDQGEPMAEHRVYLASVGLFLAAGVGDRPACDRGSDRAGASAAAAGARGAGGGAAVAGDAHRVTKQRVGEPRDAHARVGGPGAQPLPAAAAARRGASGHGSPGGGGRGVQERHPAAAERPDGLREARTMPVRNGTAAGGAVVFCRCASSRTRATSWRSSHFACSMNGNPGLSPMPAAADTVASPRAPRARAASAPA